MGYAVPGKQGRLKLLQKSCRSRRICPPCGSCCTNTIRLLKKSSSPNENPFMNQRPAMPRPDAP
jgi:hypothetical protein